MLVDQSSKFELASRLPKKTGKTTTQHDQLIKQHKLSESEYELILKILGRTPTMAELGVFSSMWSEHCSYKSSKIHLKKLPTTGPQVVMGPGENAGVVQIEGDACVAFKMESHNHPSYIDPYQGAATGVGGILRDVFCMGARPIANVNCLRFGDTKLPYTQHLIKNATKGIGDYGNCVGIPTVHGNIEFDESYNGNCLVNAMSVGLIDKNKIFTGTASGVGNYVIYVGSATGRDGVHGATMASDSFSNQNESDEQPERAAVQVGDPFMEKLLLEATLEVLEKELVIGLQDMGAAGLTSSSFEMAQRAGTGLYIDLDQVPTRTSNLSAYELLLSESQERMLMVIEPDKWEPICEVLKKWQLSYAIIGKVTNSKKLTISYQSEVHVDIPVDPVVDQAPMYDKPQKQPTLSKFDPTKTTKYIEKQGIESTLAKCIQDSSGLHKVFHQYDRHIGNKSILQSEHDGAALVSLEAFSEDTCVVISSACNSKQCATHPKWGGAGAVILAAQRIVAMGGEPLATTDCLNFGNPDKPEIMWQFAQAVEGIGEACKALNTPIVSGNVSLYNQTDDTSILPTPMIGMVGKLKDPKQAIPATSGEAKYIYSIAPKAMQTSLNGSLVAGFAGQRPVLTEKDAHPWEEICATFEWIQSNKNKLIGCREVGKGGLLTTLAKFVHRDHLGIDFDSMLINTLSTSGFFEESFSHFVFSTKESLDVKQVGSNEALKIELIGTTNQESLFQIGKQTIDLKKLQTIFAEGPFTF